ncbi:MAG TPA: TetR/AcrR family transcriptional regulator [Taishania sp.]|nr:TetR/AcrR family transcriptional regulator [Taishania sp.]HNS41934.1 TetR/AcrR family transcriptional regulator [Taishania sp.]
MTPQERKKGKKEDVRKLILDAAKKLFIEQGYEATSMRNIATEINYSPTTIYLYYKDKGDIIYALHQEGFTILKMLFMPLATVEAPFERLKALGRTYLNFAKEYPEYYEVMFMMKEPMDHLDKTANEELWEGGKEMFGFIISTIVECQEKGFFSKDNPHYIALQAWAMVHGLCSLYLTTRIHKIGMENEAALSADALLDNAYKSFVSFIESKKMNV